MRIFDRTLGTLERALDARLLRHNVLAGNLANADTPGYVARDIDFAAALRQSAPGGPSAPTPGEAARQPQINLASWRPADAAPGSLRGADIPLSLADAGSAPGASVVTTSGSGAGLDGNAVDVDRALAAVAENAIQYNAAARAAGKKLAILRYAASDGTA